MSQVGQDSHLVLKGSTHLINCAAAEEGHESGTGVGAKEHSAPWGIVHRAKGQSWWKVRTAGWGLLFTLTFGDAVLCGQEALLEEALQHGAHRGPVN